MILLLRAFRHRHYRLFFGGQAISLTGLWLQWTAQSWLIFRLTDAAVWVGVVTLALQGPGLFLGPLAGVLADRRDKRHLLVVAQSIAIVPAATLGVLTVLGVVQPWHIVACALVAGLARAFEIPTRQAFVPELVEPADLPNAIALNSSLFNGARLVGPGLAGVVIPLVGEGWCFLANAVAYVGVVVSLLAIRRPPRHSSRGRAGSFFAELREGVAYVVRQPMLMGLLGTLAGASLFGMPYSVLLPSFSQRHLGGGPETFSQLQVAVGVGALVTSVVLAFRARVGGMRALVTWAAVAYGGLLAALSLVHSVAVAVVVLGLIGCAFMAQLTMTSTLVQTLAPDHLRGRVLSIQTTIFLGLFPVAGIGAGWLADRIGEPRVLQMGGGAVVLIALLCAHKIGRGPIVRDPIEMLSEEPRLPERSSPERSSPEKSSPESLPPESLPPKEPLAPEAMLPEKVQPR